MKTFNSTMMLPLVASLALGMGLSTQASALEQNKDFTIKPDAYPTTADCYVHTPKGCPIHVGYDAQGWYPDVHGRHTNAKNDVNACFDRAADYDDWCGGDEATQALFVSNTGEVTLDSAADAESFSGGQTVYLKSHHGTYFYMADGDFKVGTKSVSSKMELVRVSGSGPIKFGDKIALKSVDGSGVYVTALHAGEQHNAVARATKLQGWETFTIVDRNGNTPNLVVTAETAFALKGAHGLHIAGTPDGKAVASVPHIDDWEMVRLEAAPSAASFNSGQTVYLKSHHGTYFYMADGDFKVGTKRASSKMELVRVGGSGPIKFGDQIALKSVDGSGVYVTALHAGEQHNAVARATKLQGWETFTIVDRNGNTPNVVVTTDTAFALKGAHGLHIAGTPDGKAVASVPHIDDWEMVRLEEVPVDDGVAQTTEDEPAGYFYIPAQSCTQDIGSVDASLGQRGALSACEIRAEVTQSGNAAVWTLTLPGSTMIERIDFSDAAHLKDAVLTIEDPELPEGKQVIYTSEPLNPDGAASFSVTDEMYDASSTEYSWLVFGGVIRIHTNGAGIEGAVVKVIQGDVSQLSLNPTTAQAALVHDLATANHNLEQAEQEASREIPVPVETNLSVDLMTAGPTWMDANGQAMATYSLPPRSTVPAGYAHGPWKTREANAQYGLHIGAAKSGNENGEFYWVKELNAPNGIEIDIEYNGEKVLPFSHDKDAEIWGTRTGNKDWNAEGLVTAPSSQVDRLKLGYKHNRVLWKLFFTDELLVQGTEVYLQGICGRNYASEGNGYDEWAPGGNHRAKDLFCTPNDDGGFLHNTGNGEGVRFAHASNYSMDGNTGFGNFREKNAWIIHPVAGTTSVGANGAGSAIQGYSHTANAAISGHNREHLLKVSPADCAQECDSRDWCVSFDYHKAGRSCHLSEMSADTVDLKTDYAGNPYDHYTVKQAIHGYSHTANAAISGHNREHLSGVSPADCAQECDSRDWCVSFDHHKEARTCYLSDKSAFTVDLKTNYPGNPYDHYTAKDAIQGYSHTANAAISGHNREHLLKVSPADCAQECDSRNWCVSFDYEKEARACYLSDESADTVDLKTNYPGNPYDHFTATRSDDSAGSMQFKLQSKADPSIFLGLGTLETISANGGNLQGVSFVSQLSVGDSAYQRATLDSAATFTMRWSGGETRTGPIDAELNAFALELAEVRTHFNTIERNLSNAQQTIERMKDMKDLISSTHENIKSARELTTAVKKVPMVRYVAVPFDRGLKLIEKPFSRMDSALPGKERLDQLNTLLTEIDTYLQNGKPALRVLATESEKLNAKRTNAYRPNTLPEHNGLNGCGQAMELLPSFVFQGLADAMGELNDGIDNTGSFESPPADCDEACQARVVVQNAASAVVLLANNLDRINAALEDARKYVRTINSFSKHIKAAGDKVNAGGWMTKTVEFIEDIPVIGWFVKTVRRAVEKYVVDPVMDQAMSLADGLIQPLIADAGLSPETSINDFIQVYNKAMAAKAEFNEAKKKANAKTVAINKMKKMGSAGATQAWESAKGKAYDTIVDKIQEECDLD